MCTACRPLFEEQCSRLSIPISFKNADKREDEDTPGYGEVRHLPYAIVTYGEKTIKGNAFDVVEAMKSLEPKPNENNQ